VSALLVSATRVSADLITDEAALLALGPAWDALEARAQAGGAPGQLYVSHRYVRLAWQHLRQPGDELFVLTLGDAGHLQAVWPLVLRRSRQAKMEVRQLGPIGIWEGERPHVLCEGDADTAWAGLWSALAGLRSRWHVLTLPELDAGSWPLRQLAVRPGVAGGFQVRAQADTAAPWQPLGGDAVAWRVRRPAALRQAREHVQHALKRRLPDLSTEVLNTGADMPAALDRFLAIEARLAASPLADAHYRISSKPERVAFYRAFLPLLAARGEAELRLMRGGGQDVAALIRLRCGGVWLERHAVAAPDVVDLAPAQELLLQTLAEAMRDGATQESDLLWPPDASGRVEALTPWLDGVRPTERLTIWNLRSRMALRALAGWLLRR